MTINRVVEMIDEYLLEPNNINREWIEALSLCRKVLLSDNSLKHSKWEIACDGYYPYCLECGYTPDSGKMTDYCPKCGARMDGGKNA